MSRAGLARRVDLTAAAIGQYESGVTRPSASAIAKLEVALQIPGRWLQGPELTGAAPASFRRLKRVTARDQRIAITRGRLVHRMAECLSRLVRLPDTSLPDIRLTPASTVEDIEAAATKTRQALGIEEGPAGRIIRRLEHVGVIVARISLPAGIDAFSMPYESRPVMLLDAGIADAGRDRMDSSHETGHLVGHRHEPLAGERWMEAQAFRFAGAFLLPQEEAWYVLPRYPDWDRMLAVKEQWGISLAAQVKRADDLGLMSKENQVRAYRYLRWRNWHKQEPLDLGPVEQPTLLGTARQLAGDQEAAALAELIDSETFGEDVVA